MNLLEPKQRQAMRDMEATSKGIHGNEPQQSALNMVFSVTYHSELQSALSF
jgi:hypothetical protein